MDSFSMESLPLGFRFRPTDEELINHYLRLKINRRHSEVQVIPEIDMCKREPWDLPGLSVIKTEDPEWFFFCPRDRKYPNGHRSNRATEVGYWKATGKDRNIKSRKSSGSTLIGTKKTLVFYRGRAPKGLRTCWIMHEYRATTKDLDGTGPGQEAFVLCRLFHKPDEKTNISNYDEVDPTGLSPITVKSTPEDASSDIVQEIDASDNMRIGNKIGDFKMWQIDEADDMTSGVALLDEVGCNNSMGSDVEDSVPEEAATAVLPHMGEDLTFYKPSCDEIDFNNLSPLQLQAQTDIGPYFDSHFDCDFGYDHNGYPFQDGSTEQDISLTDLLEEAFDNKSENPGVGTEETQEFGHVVESGSFDYLSGNHEEIGSRYNVNECAGGFGIKIRARQPRQIPNPENFATQGSAPRRLRLQIHSSSGSNFTPKLGVISSPEEEHDAQSRVTEVQNDKNVMKNHTDGEVKKEIAGSNLRLKKKWDDESDDCKMNTVVHGVAFLSHRTLHIIGSSLIVISFAAFMGYLGVFSL